MRKVVIILILIPVTLILVGVILAVTASHRHQALEDAAVQRMQSSFDAITGQVASAKVLQVPKDPYCQDASTGFADYFECYVAFELSVPNSDVAQVESIIQAQGYSKISKENWQDMRYASEAADHSFFEFPYYNYKMKKTGPITEIQNFRYNDTYRGFSCAINCGPRKLFF